MNLSIVIPAFEESKKISADIEVAAKFLESNHLEGEIIVVDDGSKDNTSEAAKKAAAGLSAGISSKVIRLWKRFRGLKYAEKRGMQYSTRLEKNAGKSD
jgi:glycosyltransferase involved in cell wall biosynthesis